MGCRNRVLLEDESPASASLNNALLFTTMCIVGLPVDVHVKDGSIYSGIFHTASVEKDYAIVLKKARMTTNGNCFANVPEEGHIETLIVSSDDLVQVVAKGLVLPADGVPKNVADDFIGVTAASVPSVNCPADQPKSSNACVNVAHTSQIRSSPQVQNDCAACFPCEPMNGLGDSLIFENGKLDGLDFAKKEEALSNSVNERQTGHGRLQGNQRDCRDEFRKLDTSVENGGFQSSDACDTETMFVRNIDPKTATKLLPNVVPSECCESSFTGSANDDRHHLRHSPANILSSNFTSSGISASIGSTVNATSESCLSLSSKSLHSVRGTKESKLNPGAKIFSPSLAHQRSTTPSASTIAGSTYVPDNCSVVAMTMALPEVEINSFAPCPALPVKFVPYGNLMGGNGGRDPQYSQPLVGHMGNRSQPVRYPSQYHTVQVGPGYMHPTTQNVMVGRISPLFYVHPVSNDVVQNAAALSQVSMHPMHTPQHVHLSKQQGHGASHALQVYVAPPLLTNGQQPFMMPNHVPLSQPSYPVLHPNPITGTHTLLGSKYT